MTKTKIFRRVTALLLCCALIFGACSVMVSAAPFGGAKTVTYVGSDWMAALPDDVTIKQITMPGTHDTGTFNIQYRELDADGLHELIASLGLPTFDGLGTYLPNDLMDMVASRLRDVITFCQIQAGRCQSRDIGEQLADGVRAMDLRYRYDGGAFNVYHGVFTEGIEAQLFVCECYTRGGERLTLDHIFATIAEFVKAHPTETVLLTLSNEGGEVSETVTKALEELKAKYGIYLADEQYGDLTLEEARGKIFDISVFPIEGVTGSNTLPPAEKCRNVVNALNNSPLASETTHIQMLALNQPVKFYKIYDPSNECSLGVKVIWGKRWFFRYPVGVTLDLEHLFKTPYSQSLQVNAIVDNLNSPFTRAMMGIHLKEGQVFGIIRMDFANESRCWNVVSQNRWMGCNFVYNPFKK